MMLDDTRISYEESIRRRKAIKRERFVIREQHGLYKVALDGVEGSVGPERRRWTELAASILRDLSL